MALETILTTSPPGQWVTRQAVIFDWHDGPRQGVCALAVPSCEFVFDLLDERLNPDDLDDRLFRVRELPPGAVAELLTALRPLGGPAGPVWVPFWRFPTEAERRPAEAKVNALLAGARPTPVVIATRDMQQFLGCWNVPGNANGVTDWFAVLPFPQENPA